jgi:hypothetical protein
VYQADPVKTVPQDLLEILDLLDLLDQQANPELQGMKVSPDRRDLEDTTENPARMESQDHLVQRVHLGLTEHQAKTAMQVLLEALEKTDTMALPVHEV